MNKFENVDVLASLQQIMQQNTAAFQNDFDIDKKILTRAAKNKNAEDKVYLWFSRPNGTHCLRERDVFLRGTREHNTFRFYHEQTKERVLSNVSICWTRAFSNSLSMIGLFSGMPRNSNTYGSLIISLGDVSSIPLCASASTVSLFVFPSDSNSRS